MPKVKKEVKSNFVGYAVVIHKIKKGQEMSEFTIKNEKGESPDKIVPIYIDKRDYETGISGKKPMTDEDLGSILRFGIGKLNNRF